MTQDRAQQGQDNTSGHTPLPWKLFNRNGVIAIKSAEKQSHNEIVFWTGFDASHYPEAAAANAALIVTAVNSHAALLAERDALRSALRTAFNYLGNNDPYAVHKARSALEDALSVARHEQDSASGGRT